MFCPNCGQTVSANTSFCPNCGHSITSDQNDERPSDGASSRSDMQQPTEPMVTPTSFQQVSQIPIRKKKRHGCLITFLVILMLLIAGGAAVYLLMPGLARPVNLGVKTSQQAYESTLKKIKYTKDQAPTTGQQHEYKYVYGPLVQIDTNLSSEEVTSFFNYNRPPYFPLTNVQVKIGSASSLWSDSGRYAGVVSLTTAKMAAATDVPIEVSATIDRDYTLKSLLGSQYSQAEVQEALKSINIEKIIPAKVNLYVKMSGSILNNKVVNLKLYTASVMGVAIPMENVTSADARTLVGNVIDKLLADYNASSGTVFVSIRAENGQILLSGKVPSSLARTPIS